MFPSKFEIFVLVTESNTISKAKRLQERALPQLARNRSQHPLLLADKNPCCSLALELPCCLMWTIWKERNQRTFEDVSKLDSQILEGFILTLFDWSRAWGFTTHTSIPDFISSLLLISHDVYS